MKKTILTKKVDGLDVVMGFDNAVIDPITTRNKVFELLKETTEYKDHQEKALFIGEKIKEHILLLSKRNKSDESKKALTDLHDEIESLQKELVESAKIIDTKAKEIHKENLIYFNPKAGEDIIDDAVAEASILVFKALKKDELLLVDGSIIPNHKGKIVLIKENGELVEYLITKIGEELPAKAKLMNSLTTEEKTNFLKGKERKRIKGLTPEQKQAEKKSAIDSALSDAAHLKIQYEITDEENPLKKSQTWFKEKKAEIESKYS